MQVAVVDEDHSEFSRRIVDGLRKESAQRARFRRVARTRKAGTFRFREGPVDVRVPDLIGGDAEVGEGRREVVVERHRGPHGPVEEER